jgi:ribonuclease P protein component
MAGPPPESFAFPRELRLRRPADFRAVYDRKRSASDAVLIVYGGPNDLGHPRLGLSVSRKYGNAVRRNRFKRLCREAFRLGRTQVPPLDLIVIPRAKEPPTLAFLLEALPRLAGQVARRLEKDARAPR